MLRVLKYLILGLLSLFVVLVAVVFLTPKSTYKSLIEKTVAKATNGELTIGQFDFGVYPHLHVNLEQVDFRTKPNADAIVLDHFDASIGWTGLLSAANGKVDADFNVKFANSDLSGSADINWYGEPIPVQFNVHSQRMDLNAIETMLKGFVAKEQSGNVSHQSQQMQAAETEASQEVNKLFSDDPIVLDDLAKFKVDGKVAVNELLYKGERINDLSLGLKLNDSKLQVRMKPVKVLTGQAGAKIDLDAAKQPYTLSVDLKLHHIDVGQAVAVTGVSQDLHGGDMFASVELDAQGKSLHQLMSTLSGHTTVMLSDSEYTKKVGSQKKGANTLLRLLAGGNEEKGITIGCVFNQMEIDKGLAESKALVIDTSGALVLGKGNINLGEEKLNLTLTPKAKTVGLADLAVPIKIHGPLAKPKFKLEEVGAAIGAAKTMLGFATGGLSVVADKAFAEVSNEYQNPCLERLKGKQQGSDKTEQETKQEPKKKKSIFPFF